MPAVVELRATQWPDDIATPESFAWAMDHTTPDEHVGRWVAADGTDIVGWATAGLDSWTTESLGFIYLGVRRDHRRQGVGDRLFRVADEHLASLSPDKTRTGTERGDEDGARFVERRGFRRGRADQVWGVDPSTVPRGQLGPRLASARTDGLLLVPVRKLMDRPEELFALTQALERDLPTDEPISRSYADWEAHDLRTPLFSPDASFCLLASDGQPVSLTWIFFDPTHHRARHGLTGTLPAYRRRGLAHMVKLASIDWLASHGVTALFTDNDTENSDMLALNAHLGFRPLTIFDLWTRYA